MNTQPGYESLASVLQQALDQAQNGKGAERHANSLPFDKQPMQTIAGQVGIGFLTGQAIKKTQESQTLPPGRDVAELLGAINYLAGAVLFLEMKRAIDEAKDEAARRVLQASGLVGANDNCRTSLSRCPACADGYCPLHNVNSKEN